MNKLPLTIAEKIVVGLSIALIIGLFGYVGYSYPSLPDTIPTHYDVYGIADNFGSKGWIWFVPCIMLAIFIMFVLIARFGKTFNAPVEVTEENKERLYLNGRLLIYMMAFETVVFFWWNEFTEIQSINGNGETLGAESLLVFVGIFILTIIFFVVRSHRLK
ncbi:DUF1648 domain-containing protein [Priestia taiwanensis]|uniref:DUF1648 domain-containing protein n=1 Tax=Priestia taiwanensis TaxID=1347902 RepID=A0A917ARS2_9BACI|nr:DUF1648 domain-containing protein [Priestia taiwanensis]MBM7363138.1 putative membrane protein [Priestia taiwanensis]GGE68003.1 hypothetical protein GCM10007140_17580 [Priestia taiwanensis]